MSRRLVLAATAAGLLAAPLLHAAAAEPVPVEMCNIPIRMSDGADLRANVVRPAETGTRPTILLVTGYNKDLATRTGDCASADPVLSAAGYNVMAVDDRGTGSSDGRWGRWDPRTQQDYRELLAWLKRQPWHDGNVGTTGTSYLGITSLLVAATGDPQVKAVWADVPMGDAYRDGTTYFGGNFNTTFFPAWLALTQAMNANTPTQAVQGEPLPEVALNAVDHWAGGPVAGTGGDALVAGLLGDEKAAAPPYDSPVLQAKSPATRGPEIKAAVWWNGGWFDIFQRGEAALWNALSSTPPGGKKWVQSPVYHAGGTSHWDEMGLGRKNDVKVKWFDKWLRGARNGIERTPPIHQWVVGAEKWERPKDWPAPTTSWQRMHLSPEPSGSGARSLADGTLTTAVPKAPAVTRLPHVPVGGLCNNSTHQWSMGFAAGVKCADDQRASEATTLTWTTAPYDKGLHLAGPMTLTLHAELDRPDMSFYVAVTDVAPDGTSRQITSGALNASHRALDAKRTQRNARGDVIVPWHPFTVEAQRDVPLHQPQQYEIEVFPTNWQLQPGHRLRVVLGTADTPHFTVPAKAAQRMVGGTVKVLSGPRYPSRLVVPVQPLVR